MKPELQVRTADLVWIGLAFLVLIFAGFGLRDPWPADEPRFAGVAFDMVRSGYWLIPHAGGDLYQDKPPLHFWMIAASHVLTGSTRAAFLLPSMLASLGTLLLVYDLGRRLHGREAGLAAALTLACCVQFVQVTRGAQIDATLIFFITLSVWALSRHLLLGPHLGLALLGGVAAGLGVIDKAVGFLALLLLPLAWLLRRRASGAIAAGALRPAALLAVMAGFFGVIAAWLLPMLWHVQQVGTPELAAYRDELLFQQTVKRYTDAWHHIRPPYYYLVEVIPALWLPLSVLLFWLWRPWREDWRAHRAATLLPLGFAVAVVLFFSLSTGKRGVYVLPALPALALAAAPHLTALYRRISVGRVSLVLGAVLLIPAWAVVLGAALGMSKASALLDDTPLDSLAPLWAFAVIGLA
ncbi:MAG: ArnT family glycosyltransferase, partial [Gammaproteobacteria bacterium]